MKKNKIADSIIIRVGGGIREVHRETNEITDIVESVETETSLDTTENVHSFKPDASTVTSISKDKAIN